MCAHLQEERRFGVFGVSNSWYRGFLALTRSDRDESRPSSWEQMFWFCSNIAVDGMVTISTGIVAVESVVIVVMDKVSMIITVTTVVMEKDALVPITVTTVVMEEDALVPITITTVVMLWYPLL